MDTAQVRKQPRPIRHDVEDCDELYETRMPSSVRRYHTNPPVQADTLDDLYEDEPQYIQQRRASRKMPSAPKRTTKPTTVSTIAEAAPEYRAAEAKLEYSTDALPGPRRFPLVHVVIGMVIMIVLVMSLSLFFSWWQGYQDDLHYGRPRTSQLDAVVGHNDSPEHPTHFIFLNLNRHVQIIEIPGGDASKMRVFIGPVLFGDGQDLTPVTGEIRDINGHKDLIVHIQNQEIVFINDGNTFHSQ